MVIGNVADPILMGWWNYEQSIFLGLVFYNWFYYGHIFWDSAMTEQEIKDRAPSRATYYLLVPNGSGQPYYLFKKGGYYHFFHSKDIFPYSHMIKHIKPL